MASIFCINTEIIVWSLEISLEINKWITLNKTNLEVSCVLLRSLCYLITQNKGSTQILNSKSVLFQRLVKSRRNHPIYTTLLNACPHSEWHHIVSYTLFSVYIQMDTIYKSIHLSQNTETFFLSKSLVITLILQINQLFCRLIYSHHVANIFPLDYKHRECLSSKNHMWFFHYHFGHSKILI